MLFNQTFAKDQIIVINKADDVSIRSVKLIYLTLFSSMTLVLINDSSSFRSQPSCILQLQQRRGSQSEFSLCLTALPQVRKCKTASKLFPLSIHLLIDRQFSHLWNISTIIGCIQTFPEDESNWFVIPSLVIWCHCAVHICASEENVSTSDCHKMWHTHSCLPQD